MSPNRIFLVLIVLGLFACAQSTPPANADSHATPAAEAPAAPTEEWDQEAVTALALQLNQAVDELRKAQRSAPVQTIGTGQQNSQWRFRDKLRLIQNETKHLHAQLAAGSGRGETFPVFQRISNLRREAAEDARRMFLQEQVTTKIEAAREPLEKLYSYYGGTFEPALQQRRE